MVAVGVVVAVAVAVGVVVAVVVAVGVGVAVVVAVVVAVGVAVGVGRKRMIDWTQPVETIETPPRPVRVLFDSEGVPWAALIGDDTVNALPIGNSRDVFAPFTGETLFSLRNTPAKPVRYEAWISLYADGGSAVSYSGVKGPSSVECRHIVWNSDGSPVESELLPEYMAMVADRDQWKAKAEAAQAEVPGWRKGWRKEWEILCRNVSGTLDRRRINETEALKSEIERQRAAHKAQVNRLMALLDGEKYHRKQAEEQLVLRDGKVHWHQMQVD